MAEELCVEVTVEPFVDGVPGPHVEAIMTEAEAHGMTVEFGPFGTAVSGEQEKVLACLGAILGAALAAGASRVSAQIEVR